MKTIIEPFRIKMVEPIKLTTREQREEFMQAASYLRGLGVFDGALAYLHEAHRVDDLQNGISKLFRPCVKKGDAKTVNAANIIKEIAEVLQENKGMQSVFNKMEMKMKCTLQDGVYSYVMDFE